MIRSGLNNTVVEIPGTDSHYIKEISFVPDAPVITEGRLFLFGMEDTNKLSEDKLWNILKFGNALYDEYGVYTH